MELFVGEVTHYFSRLCVAVLALQADLQVGETICIIGRITDFEQCLGSMEVQHQKISAAAAGQEVAIKVVDVVRPGDKVYKMVVD